MVFDTFAQVLAINSWPVRSDEGISLNSYENFTELSNNNMNGKEPIVATQSQSATEEILGQKFGGRVKLGPATDLGGSNRSQVLRWQVLDGPATMPTTVVTKQVITAGKQIYDPDQPNKAAWILFNDWASLQFLEQVFEEHEAIAPHFYGGNRAVGLVVMQDLGVGKRLDHFLLGDDPIAAERALLEYAATHGQLHARTSGREAEFAAIRAGLGAAYRETPFASEKRLSEVFQTFYQTAASLEIIPPVHVEAELAALRENLLKPGPFLTYIQSDACPDNCMWAEGKLRLLDFEEAGFGLCFADGVYIRSPFPSCWCVNRLPLDIMRRMETTYHAALVKGIPQAADDKLFYKGVVAACTFWFLQRLEWWPLIRILGQDQQLTISTARQELLLRTEMLANTIAEFGNFPALEATVNQMWTKLQTLWPETVNIPFYPAFAGNIKEYRANKYR